MTTGAKSIRARIQCIDGSDDIKKFTPVAQLPIAGSVISGTKYYYDKSRQATLSKVQRTRDDFIQSKYDFYITNAVDKDGKSVGELYFCIPHEKVNKPSRKMYNMFLSKAKDYDDIEKYVNDMMNSDIWDKEDVSNENRETWLKSLYVGANMTVEDLIKKYGMTQTQFCNHFGVPKRTVENWIYIRQPPLYLLALFEENLGIIKCE